MLADNWIVPSITYKPPQISFSDSVAIATAYSVYMAGSSALDAILGLQLPSSDRTRTVEEMMGLATLSYRSGLDSPKWNYISSVYSDRDSWRTPAYKRNRTPVGEPSPLLLSLIRNL